MALRHHRNRALIRKAHYVALISITACLIVATAAAQAQAKISPLQIIGLDCSKTPPPHAFNTATCMFTTSVPAETSVSTGTDKQYIVPTPDLHYRTKHTITVPGLSPNTPYYALVTATNKAGESARVWTSFKTAAPGSSPATVTTRGNKLLLNGSAFFPIMTRVFSVCPETQFVNGSISLGASIVDDVQNMGNQCPGTNTSPDQWGATLHTVLDNSIWWYESTPANSEQLQSQNMTELLGPSAILTPWHKSSNELIDESLCKSLEPYFNGLKAFASREPLIYTILLGRHAINSHIENCMTPSSLKMYFWGAVINNAHGILYSTNSTGNGDPDFDVDGELQAQAIKLSRQMGTVGPVIQTGKNIATKTDPKSTIRMSAWQYGDDTYIVAVNTQSTATSGTFSVGNLAKARTAQVMWEGRNVKVNAASIHDNFAPLATHIYKVLPATKK